ncbi:NYN domain-containing protein [Roseovarius sp. 2305UL8-3]|uniref:NYN domain-containing protein n=1 Tax=Roseovarius conchicola TaxID=3121636 RepID=UPI0035272D65
MSDPRQTPLLAVLIDADNTSPKWAGALFDEITTIGEASVRRCYGDFSSQQMSGWSKVQAEYGLVPHHQPANTVGKNASDIALVIDAMDLMHSGRFDGFVLVSSDSDFTRLASRLREQGLDVFGIGAAKTPKAFVNACKRFLYLENLDISEGQVGKSAGKPKAAKLETAHGLVLKAMDSIDQGSDWYALSVLGKQLVAANLDFDTRTYGKRKLSDLVSAIKVFQTRREGNQLMVRRID